MIITYTVPPNPPKRYETGMPAITIGRGPVRDKPIDLDLAPDGTISHIHARLTLEAGEYWIEDLGSRNGTCVDGTVITEKTQLTADSVINIGTTTLRVIPLAPEPDNVPFPTIPKDADVITPPAPEIEDEFQDEAALPPAMPPAQVSGKSQEEAPVETVRPLKAFSDLSRALAISSTMDHLSTILVEQLRLAIPNAQRGAVLLPDEKDQLLLSIHWPKGDHSVSMTWARQAYDTRSVVSHRAESDPRLAEAMPQSAIGYQVQAALYVPLTAAGRAVGVMYVDSYVTQDAFSDDDRDLLRAIALQVAVFVRDNVLESDLKRQDAFRSNLMRQFSPKVADRLLSEAHRHRGERVNPVTILISDIRNFTAMAAKMEPGNVVRMLNEMFDAFVPIVFEYDGVVDKYVGDSILAVFGSPEPDNDQWAKAVKAAARMQTAIHKLGEGWLVRRLPIFQVGIGIHSGEVIQGFIGASQRIEYTVIGNTVNVAARFCDGAAPGEIVISKAVYERVFQQVNVVSRTIRTKHPEKEPDLEAYVVRSLRRPAQPQEGEEPSP